MPDAQTIWNALLGLFALAITGAMNVLRESLKDLQAADKSLTDKVQRIELLVAGDYVKKDDLDRKLERIFSKLEAIDSKLDNKVDRGDCPIIHGANKL
jgi:CHASE3 domain sensor protein